MEKQTTKMQIFYNNIKDTFLSQLQYTKELIEIADEKTQAIRDNDVSRIMQLTNREEDCARNIITLEKNRDSYIKDFERKENTKIENLSDVLEKISPKSGVELNLIATDLKESLETLKNKNDVNKTLMSFILEQIEIANNLIKGDRVPNTYENTKFSKKSYNNTAVDGSYFDSKY